MAASRAHTVAGIVAVLRPPAAKRGVRVSTVRVQVGDEVGVVAEVRDALTRELLAMSGRKRLEQLAGKCGVVRARDEAREVCRVHGWDAGE